MNRASAQASRLILSTLHTNTAGGAVQRMVDHGLPEFLVRDVLRGVLGQTLVPVTCPQCGGSGCDRCNHCGVVGRELSTEFWAL